jgi:hypothetical protein
MYLSADPVEIVRKSQRSEAWDAGRCSSASQDGAGAAAENKRWDLSAFTPLDRPARHSTAQHTAHGRRRRDAACGTGSGKMLRRRDGVAMMCEQRAAAAVAAPIFPSGWVVPQAKNLKQETSSCTPACLLRMSCCAASSPYPWRNSAEQTSDVKGNHPPCTSPAAS